MDEGAVGHLEEDEDVSDYLGVDVKARLDEVDPVKCSVESLGTLDLVLRRGMGLELE